MGFKETLTVMTCGYYHYTNYYIMVSLWPDDTLGINIQGFVYSYECVPESKACNFDWLANSYWNYPKVDLTVALQL